MMHINIHTIKGQKIPKVINTLESGLEFLSEQTDFSLMYVLLLH